MIVASAGDLSSDTGRRIAQTSLFAGRLAHLSINDICNVTGGEERHADKLQHVWEVRLSLLPVVFDPVQHGLKDRLL